MEEMPVYSTKASQFNDWGTTELYNELIKKLNEKFDGLNLSGYIEQNVSEETTIIPPKRVRYLSEIVENNRAYDKDVVDQALIARKLYQLQGAKNILEDDVNSQEILEKDIRKSKKILARKIFIS